jgi:tetratricopeptide (TPR) repeat protein
VQDALGALRAIRGDWLAAEVHWRRGLARGQTEARLARELRRRLVLLLVAEHRPAEALALLGTAWAHDPGVDARAMAERVRLHRALDAGEGRGAGAGAEELLRHWQELARDGGPVELLEVRRELGLQLSPDPALESAVEVARAGWGAGLEPGLTDLRAERGLELSRLLVLAGRHEEARAILERVSPVALRENGCTVLSLYRQIGESGELLARARQLAALTAPPACALRVLTEQGDRSDERRVAEALLFARLREPISADLFYALALRAERAGELDESLRWLDRARRLAPDDADLLAVHSRLLGARKARAAAPSAGDGRLR